MKFVHSLSVLQHKLRALTELEKAKEWDIKTKIFFHNCHPTSHSANDPDCILWIIVVNFMRYRNLSVCTNVRMYVILRFTLDECKTDFRICTDSSFALVLPLPLALALCECLCLHAEMPTFAFIKSARTFHKHTHYGCEAKNWSHKYIPSIAQHISD